MTRLPKFPLILACALMLPAGCGGDGDDGPSSEQILLVQRSTGASGAMAEVAEAANAGILAGGSESAAPGPHAVPTFPGATPAFDFAANVDVIFDLDALNADGIDPFPNTSGQIHVVATGTMTGTDAEGQATYSVTVTAETDLSMTHPDTGAETEIPAGASWSYLLTVTWSVTDDRNWTVTAVATTDVDVQDVTVDDGSALVTVDVVGQRQVTASFTRSNGRLEHERLFEGSMTTTVDDGATVESVVFEWTQPGRVRISVLGGMFGPMSEGQAESLFRTAIS